MNVPGTLKILRDADGSDAPVQLDEVAILGDVEVIRALGAF